jgi:hypothetical protein
VSTAEHSSNLFKELFAGDFLRDSGQQIFPSLYSTYSMDEAGQHKAAGDEARFDGPAHCAAQVCV